MRILQQLPASCACPECDSGCQCGDCGVCSNESLDSAVSTYAKRIGVAACVFLALGGFVFFMPVVAIGATPPVTQSISVKVETADNSTQPLGSIGFCYLGVGAVLVHGVYYPSVTENLTTKRACS